MYKTSNTNDRFDQALDTIIREMNEMHEEIARLSAMRDDRTQRLRDVLGVLPNVVEPDNR